MQHLSNEDLEARLASVNAAVRFSPNATNTSTNIRYSQLHPTDRDIVLQRRIAEFLVTVADSEERRTLLKEALTPPEPQAQNASSEAAPQVDKSMSDLLASLMDTMEGSEGSSLSDDAAFPKQQASDPGNKAVTQTPEDDISAANLTEREAASGSGESQSETEVVEDLLHTSPLQLLQARFPSCSSLDSTTVDLRFSSRVLRSLFIGSNWFKLLFYQPLDQRSAPFCATNHNTKGMLVVATSFATYVACWLLQGVCGV